MTVDLFIPCYIDQFSPQTGFNAIKVLEKCGLTVNYNPEQTCCGREVYEAGFFDYARDLGEKFLNDFSGENPIVGLSTACVAHVQTNFEKLFYNSASHLEYKKVETNIFEFTDFIVNGLNKYDFGAELEGTAIYHDSCHALRKYKSRIKEEPRKLLKHVKGLNLVELENEECCGFGGFFSLEYSSISSAMVERKVRAALDLNVTHIISSDITCLINFQAYIDKFNLPIKTLHIADVIASSL